MVAFATKIPQVSSPVQYSATDQSFVCVGNLKNVQSSISCFCRVSSIAFLNEILCTVKCVSSAI